MPSKLLALTDEQLTTVFNMAAPLASHSRRCGALALRSARAGRRRRGKGVRRGPEVLLARTRSVARGRDQQVSLNHLFALLIVLAPAARCEVDQRAFAHEGDASPIAIDVPGGSFADEFAQRIAWAEA